LEEEGDSFCNEVALIHVDHYQGFVGWKFVQVGDEST
jgi:hypothetical protein